MTRMTAIGVVAALVPLAARQARRARGRARRPATTTERPTVSVAKVARGDLAQTLTLAAEFRPFQEIEVHAKVAGYVKSINVDVGDRVSAGQLLAVLEIPELQDDMAQDEAGGQAQPGGSEPRAGRSRARRVGARGRASRRRRASPA